MADTSNKVTVSVCVKNKEKFPSKSYIIQYHFHGIDHDRGCVNKSLLLRTRK